MADEIHIVQRLRLVNGSLNYEFRNDIKADQSELGANDILRNVGTSQEDSTLDNITTAGWTHLYNIDSANYVTWGPKSAGVMVPFGRLKAGEPALFRIAGGVTLRWQANSAACEVRHTGLET